MALSKLNTVDWSSIAKFNGIDQANIVSINGIAAPVAASGWTYLSEVDLTNGGANDLTEATLASGLPSGLETIEVMLTDVSLDTGVNNTSNGETAVSAFYTSRSVDVAAADVQTTIFTLSRWDTSEHLWFSFGHSHEHTNTATRVGCGYKTLSGEITQIRVISNNGVAQFDGGTAIVRYM